MSQYIINPFFQFGGQPLLTRNAWVELARVTLGAPATTLDVIVPTPKRFYMVIIKTTGQDNSASNTSLRVGDSVGGIDTGNNSAFRRSNNGGGDSTANNGDRPLGDTWNSNAGTLQPIFEVFYVDNNPTGEKLFTCHSLQQEGVGFGIAPERNEIVGKWSNLLALIDRFQFFINGGHSFLAGSEMVVLGFDPADGLDATANFWQPLAVAQGPAIIGTSAISFISTPTFPARKYLWIQGYLHQDVGAGGDVNQLFNFNGSDPFATTTISERFSKNGAADIPRINRANIQTLENGSTGNALAEMFVSNENGFEKLVIEHMVNNPVDGSANVPKRQEGVAKYVVTGGQITKVSMVEGTAGTFDANSFLKVWGHD